MKYLFLLASLGVATTGPAWSQRLAYTVEPAGQATDKLRVTLTYQTADTTQTTFHYPTNFWGETNLENCLTELQANMPLQRETTGDWVVVTVRHRPGQRVRLRYTIRPDQHDTLRNERTFRPIIEQGYFHVYGFALFMKPLRYWASEQDQQKVRVQWRLPKSMPFLSSLQPQTASRVQVTGRRSLLESSMFLGGKLQLQALPVGQTQVWFATRPFRHFQVDSAARHLQLAVQAQRAFWQDPGPPSFLVSLLPTYDPWTERKHRQSVSGTALADSFSAFATDNKGPAIASRVDYLLFHELMHTWIGHQIRIRKEERQYWFSEGFTEYFQTQLRLRTHLLTPAQYVAELNTEVVRPLYLSPVRNVPNDSLNYQRFWTSRDYEKLPYRRGFLFALYLDNQLKNTTPHSLADCMRAILARSYTTNREGFTDAELLAIIRETTGFDPTPAYHRYIQQGQLIDFVTLSLPPGLRVQPAATDSVPVFEVSGPPSEALYQFLIR
ncbi:hypothetical protein K3G63_01875 [Hymenobacter sp. HSC-4F20]|uniref:M61 family metallopeptidase n=1 Tax=Hymenobacter sp. HSC-4F20 TaxID=2864135 RepID=UPI001C7366AD|nr:hypothetical protein [Hymenobacter sp. HSC-4F20]MBX0289165.1 hypothetical protein [Hymenobacter sp. HSC-4F20]